MNKSDMLQLGHAAAPLKLEEDVGVDGATTLEAETDGGEDVVDEVPVELFGDGVDALPLVNLDSEDDGGRCTTSVSAFRLLLLLLFRAALVAAATLLLACTAAAAAAAAAVVKL